MGGGEERTLCAYPEVGLEDMGPPHLQLSCSLAVPGELLPAVIHDAHVHKEVRPALALPVEQLLLLAQGALAALQPHPGGVRHSVASRVVGVGAKSDGVG